MRVGADGGDRDGGGGNGARVVGDRQTAWSGCQPPGRALMRGNLGRGGRAPTVMVVVVGIRAVGLAPDPVAVICRRCLLCTSPCPVAEHRRCWCWRASPEYAALIGDTTIQVGRHAALRRINRGVNVRRLVAGVCWRLIMGRTRGLLARAKRGRGAGNRGKRGDANGGLVGVGSDAGPLGLAVDEGLAFLAVAVIAATPRLRQPGGRWWSLSRALARRSCRRCRG